MTAVATRRKNDSATGRAFIRVACSSCQHGFKVPPEHAGRRGKCPACKAEVRVPDPDGLRAKKREASPAPAPRSAMPARDPRSYVLKDGAVRVPQVCACCLAEATHELEVTKTKSEWVVVATIKRTRTLSFPFCQTCAAHESWARLGGAGGVVMIGLVSGGIASVAVCMAYRAWAGSFFNWSSHATQDRIALAVAVLLGGAIAAMVTRLLWMSRRPSVEVGCQHACTRGKSVEIADFSEGYTKLEFANPDFGRAFAAVNG